MNRIEWRILILLVISVFVNYADRGNLSIAAPLLSTEMGIQPAQMGFLLAAFSWTYALLQLFGIAGWLADKFDVYWVLAIGYFLWSGATAATGFIEGFGALFVMRLILGIGESVAYPCYSLILARYFPEQHRGLANALIDAGSKMGPAVGTLFGGLAVARIGWRALFIYLGAGALIWLVPWLLGKPKQQTLTMALSGPAPSVGEIISKRSAWGTFFGLFCVNYFWYFLLTWLPSYMVRDLHFSMDRMAYMGALSYLAIAVSTVISGWLSDHLIRKGSSVTKVRKGMAVSGLLAATIILPVAFVEDVNTALALLFAACIGFGMLTSNHWAITQTLAGPCAAGRWTSLQNGVGNLAGIAAPWFTGIAVQATGSFKVAFGAAAGAALIGACMYAFVIGRVEPVSWKSEQQAAATT